MWLPAWRQEAYQGGSANKRYGDFHLIHFDSQPHSPIEIPVQSLARWVIIAQGLFDSHLIEGAHAGQLIARYRFHFREGEPVVVPIRERFESDFVPPEWGLQYWGQPPFLAVPDRYDSLWHRDAGPWELTGLRQMEVNQASPECYDQAVPHHDGFFHRGIMAHTSPVYVAVGGEWWMSNADTSQYMLTLLHGGLEYIRRRAPLHTHGTVTHHHGEDDHQAFPERPFHEAIEVVHRHSH